MNKKRFSEEQIIAVLKEAEAAATALNLPFGTLYPFSVSLKPMEALLAVGRAEMSSRSPPSPSRSE